MENDLKIMPGADHISEWSRMFSVLENMQSELNFYQDELLFLNKLIEKYFMHLMEDESLHTLNDISIRLQKIEAIRKSIHSENYRIMKKIGLLLENPFSHNEHEIQDHFNINFSHINEFKMGLRVLKSEIFEILEKSLRSEKARKLLSR
jgi:predicted phage-related endonuclease